MAGSASLAQVAGRRFAGPPVLFYLIVDLLAVNERRQASALDSRNMDKNVLSTTVRLNEAKALGRVEPLYRSSRHIGVSLPQVSTCPFGCRTGRCHQIGCSKWR